MACGLTRSLAAAKLSTPQVPQDLRSCPHVHGQQEIHSVGIQDIHKQDHEQTADFSIHQVPVWHLIVEAIRRLKTPIIQSLDKVV